jgi:hypothetical protein
MPIFSRRRLQAMLFDIKPYADDSKLKDITNRLEDKRVKQSLPAEIELGVIWALSKLGEIEIEPEWLGSTRPDVYTESLFSGKRCVVEITAISDARLSQEDEMRRISALMCEAANKIKKESGTHLYFVFGVQSGYIEHKFIRRRMIGNHFKLAPMTTARLKDWLLNPQRTESLQIEQDETSFDILWKDAPQNSYSNFFCSMPAEASTVERNPLFARLREKEKQLALPQFEGLRCILVADVGSHMLREQKENIRTSATVNGAQVIQSFLNRSSCSVDAVISLTTARRRRKSSLDGPRLRWDTQLYTRSNMQLETTGMLTLASQLPTPRLEGYQARSFQLQAAFKPEARGWYLDMRISSGVNKMTIKISARSLLDLLAGKITLDQFQHFNGLSGKTGMGNIFLHRLNQGDVLSAARIESAGVDFDDDWLVFDLQQDPSATRLTTPKFD